MGKRDWASLPPPLLCAVAEGLIPEAYARLCAVCTDWASTLCPGEKEEGQCQPYYLPRSLHCPWLMVPSKDDLSNGCLTFLSLTESLNPYRIAAPDFFNNNNRFFIFGSHAGWFAVADEECNASLINPLTRAHIPLPSFTTITMPGLRPVEVVRDPTSRSPIEFAYNIGPSVQRYTPDKFRWTYFRKIILSSSPSSSSSPPGDYIVAFIFHYDQYLAFARAGDTAWTVLDRLPPKTYGYEDALFVDRKLYAVADNGQIDSFDFTQTEPQPELVAKRITSDSYAEPKYLVFSSGYLMQIRRTVEMDDILGFRTSGFTIQKLDLAEQGEKHWIPVDDLGCQSIFVGKSQSSVISTQTIPGVRQNCIYFTDDYVDWIVTHGRDSTRDMGVFDIKEGSCEFLYPPEAWLTWPPPIWFGSHLF